jgi:GntR family transcriptional regulator
MTMQREDGSFQAQIKRILREEITRGIWQPGARIPTEPELMQRFSVSRITVSQAMKDLVKEGLVVRRQGRGTFVADHWQGWVNLGGLLQQMPAYNGELSHGHCQIERAIPPAAVSLDLRLSLGANTWCFSRVKLTGDVPQVWEQAYIPESLVREAPVPQVNWDRQYFVTILERLTGQRARRCRAFLQAILLAHEHADAIQESPGAPAIEVVRLWYSESGLPVMLTRSVLRNAGTRYYVDLPDLDQPGRENNP